MSITDWQPVASLATLQARAALNARIRDFFSQRNVLEVETPVLGYGIGTDPNLHPLIAGYEPYPGGGTTPMYLQTSPEFAMKRLLAAGSGPVFQLCKAFRNGECGARHNPEFTMLEWYRPGFSLSQLMDEVQALVVEVLGLGTIPRRTYLSLFEEWFRLNPHTCPDQQLLDAVMARINLSHQALTRNECLELLYSHIIEPDLQDPVFICEYPACQAALARVDLDEAGHPVARRFELVVRGMELANGYDELTDAREQAERFVTDRSVRSQAGLPDLPADPRLVAALASGLPDCAGVALGVDRLLMLKLDVDLIEQVLAFPGERA